MRGWKGARRPNSFHETKFSSANGDRDKNVSPVQLVTSRIGNNNHLLIHTLLYWMLIHAIDDFRISHRP